MLGIGIHAHFHFQQVVGQFCLPIVWKLCGYESLTGLNEVPIKTAPTQQFEDGRRVLRVCHFHEPDLDA